MRKMSTKHINGIVYFILELLYHGLVNIGIDVLILLIYSFIKKYELLFLAILILSWIMVLILTIVKTRKMFKNYEKRLLAKIIAVYDNSENEMERFSNIESEILNQHVCVRKGDKRNKEIKMAYIIKAQIEQDISIVQAMSLWGIFFTLFLKVVENNTTGFPIIEIFLVLIVLLAIVLYIHIPKEKYILNVCEKIIQESKDK